MNRLAGAWRHVVGLVAGVGLVVAPIALRPAAADSSAFLSFGFEAVSDGITMTGGSPGSEGYPQVQGRTPHTEASLTTGPTGYALASGAWPGPLASGAGSLAVLLGAPEEASNANYPVRSEASSPAGPHEVEQSPGFKAFADGDVAEAFGHVDEFGNDGFSAGSVDTHSRTEVAGDLGVATARSESNDISFGGGQVTIESVVTVARASTDGVTGDTSGSTVVSGLMVGGQPARVDEHGVHFGDEDHPNPADAAAQQIGEQVLSNFGMEMYVTAPQRHSDGNVHSYQSGSLVVVWDVFNQGEGIGVWQIGGSSASVRAAPALAQPTPPGPVTTLSGPVPTAVGSIGFTPPPPPLPADEPVDEISAPPVRPSGPEPIRPAPISAEFFDGIPFAMVLAALVGSWLAARSLGRLHEQLAASADVHTCPLEDHQ